MIIIGLGKNAHIVYAYMRNFAVADSAMDVYGISSNVRLFGAMSMVIESQEKVIRYWFVRL